MGSALCVFTLDGNYGTTEVLESSETGVIRDPDVEPAFLAKNAIKGKYPSWGPEKTTGLWWKVGKKKISRVKLNNFKQTEPLGWCALTEVEVWGWNTDNNLLTNNK